MILSIMQNFDLSSLVSIASENEVEPVPPTTTNTGLKISHHFEHVKIPAQHEIKWSFIQTTHLPRKAFCFTFVLFYLSIFGKSQFYKKFPPLFLTNLF